MFKLYPDKSSFDRAVFYYAIFNRYYRKFYHHILQLLTIHKIPQNNWRILDIGCATGRFLQKLAKENTTLELYGLDISPKMIATAKHHAPTLDWQTGKAEDLPFPDQYFDLVTIIDALHYIQNQPQTFSECSRVLKPGGQFLIFTPSVDHTWSRIILMSGKLFGFATEKYIKPLRLTNINQLTKAVHLNLLDKALLTFPELLFYKYWLLLFSKSASTQNKPSNLGVFDKNTLNN